MKAFSPRKGDKWLRTRGGGADGRIEPEWSSECRLSFHCHYVCCFLTVALFLPTSLTLLADVLFVFVLAGLLASVHDHSCSPVSVLLFASRYTGMTRTVSRSQEIIALGLALVQPYAVGMKIVVKVVGQAVGHLGPMAR